MKLARLSREIVRLADTDFLLGLEPHSPVLLDYQEEFPREVSLEEFEAVIAKWRGRHLGPEHDGRMAAEVRRALALSPAEASDETAWWWLSMVGYPDVSLARWNQGAGTGLRERMLGTCGRNAFARLWWGAELVRGRDSLVEQVFNNQDLFEAVIGRKLGRLPEALEVILERLGDKPGKPARETLRDLQQVLSVVVLEALDKPDLGAQIDQLWKALATKR
jgi:uncharacterized protein DUF6339